MRTQNQEGPQVSQTFWREGGKNNTLIGALQYEASTARTNRWTKSTAAEHKTRCRHRQTALGRAKLHIASKLQTTIAHTNHSQGDPQSPKSAAFTFSSSCTRYDFSLAVPGCSRVFAASREYWRSSSSANFSLAAGDLAFACVRWAAALLSSMAVSSLAMCNLDGGTRVPARPNYTTHSTHPLHRSSQHALL